jgi:transposase
MSEDSTKPQGQAGGTQGGRRPTEVPPDAPTLTGPLLAKGRWSARRKREVVLRLLRGESIDAVSREIGVEIYRLEQWREQALEGIDANLKSRRNDPVSAELDAAMKRLGELTMENELLWNRVRSKSGPLARRRSSK